MFVAREILESVIFLNTLYLEFSTQHQVEKKENQKWSTRHETSSVWYGSFNTCQMASLESLQAGEGPTTKTSTTMVVMEVHR